MFPVVQYQLLEWNGTLDPFSKASSVVVSQCISIWDNPNTGAGPQNCSVFRGRAFLRAIIRQCEVGYQEQNIYQERYITATCCCHHPFSLKRPPLHEPAMRRKVQQIVKFPLRCWVMWNRSCELWTPTTHLRPFSSMQPFLLPPHSAIPSSFCPLPAPPPPPSQLIERKVLNCINKTQRRYSHHHYTYSHYGHISFFVLKKYICISIRALTIESNCLLVYEKIYYIYKCIFTNVLNLQSAYHLEMYLLSWREQGGLYITPGGWW